MFLSLDRYFYTSEILWKEISLQWKGFLEQGNFRVHFCQHLEKSAHIWLPRKRNLEQSSLQTSLYHSIHVPPAKEIYCI